MTDSEGREKGELSSSVDEAVVYKRHDEHWGGGPQLRLVKLRCDTLAPHQRIAIIDAVAHPEGVSIGRDKVYTPRLRIPAMKVSKHHANVFALSTTAKYGGGHTFAIVDTGSTHGTFLQHCSQRIDANDADPQTRLSAPRQASTPVVLRHLTVLRIGDTVFQVHHHATTSASSGRFSSSCDACEVRAESGEIALLAKAEAVAASVPVVRPVSTHGDRKLDAESVRRHTMKELRSQYVTNKPGGASASSSTYVDRAAARRGRLGWGGGAERPAAGPVEPITRNYPPSSTAVKPAPTTAAAALDSSNKGFQMFAAMSAAAQTSNADDGERGERSASSTPVVVRGVEGRAGLGSKRLLDVEEVACNGQRAATAGQSDYSAEASRERQRRRYDESMR